MIELIINIWDNIVDLYQHFMGVPEGITYALFGSRKRKKALNKVKDLTNQGIPDVSVPEIEQPDIPNIESQNFDGGNNTGASIAPPKPPTYKPEFPYRGNQIIIDSGRVLLNSKEDSTFIVGKKAVSISSGGTINLDSDDRCIINSPEIRLGLDASHPLVYGDELAKILNEFCVIVTETVVPDMKNAVDSQGTKVTGVSTAGVGIEKAVKGLNDGLARILSTTNFTR